jgi:hypothetical protein
MWPPDLLLPVGYLSFYVGSTRTDCTAVRLRVGVVRLPAVS